MQSALGTSVYHPCCAQSKCDATWGYYCTGQLSVHILWLWWHDQQLGPRQNCHLWETPAKMHKILSFPRKTWDKVPRGKEEGTRGIETLLVFKLGGWSTCQPEHCHGENKSAILILPKMSSTCFSCWSLSTYSTNSASNKGKKRRGTQ